MSVVSLKAVSSSKWGGQFWSKLKKTPESGPKWEKLKDSDIWTDKATYGHLHAFLAGRTQPVKSDARHLITAAVGEVTTQSMQIGEESKVIMVGPPAGVMSVAKPKVLLFEVELDWLVDENFVALAAGDTTCSLIITGEPKPTNMLLEAVQRQGR